MVEYDRPVSKLRLFLTLSPIPGLGVSEDVVYRAGQLLLAGGIAYIAAMVWFS